MQVQQASDRLSWGDTVFLHLEREGMPLNVASVCIFEGEVSFEACLQFVASKLPLLPRYMKRLVPASFGLGLPSWEFDPEFDLRRHVREAPLKRGTEAELKAYAGKIFSKLMDRQHPLWDLTLLRGLRGGQTAIILRLHHCLADGIAGVSIMNKLLDANPVPGHVPKLKLRVPPAKPRDALTSLAAGFVESYSESVKRILSALEDVVSIAERAAANGRALPAHDLSGLLPEIAAFTEPLRFNVTCRGPQAFAWTEIPLADAKAVKSACGTSVNDVILTLVTATFRRYLQAHGDPVKGRLLRLMVPVNMRGNGTAAELGNRISLVPVTIPLDVRNPRRLLAAVHRRTEFLKQAHAAELVSLAGGLIGMLPTAIQTVAGPVLSQLPITPFNLVCTNVPGPQQPLYLLGHRMLRWYPYVPVGGDMAVNCAVLSYDGHVYFGFSGDVHAAPDLRRLEKFLQLSFAELRKSAGPRSMKDAQRGKARRAPTRKGAAATAKNDSVPARAEPAPEPRPEIQAEKALAHSA